MLWCKKTNKKCNGSPITGSLWNKHCLIGVTRYASWCCGNYIRRFGRLLWFVYTFSSWSWNNNTQVSQFASKLLTCWKFCINLSCNLLENSLQSKFCMPSYNYTSASKVFLNAMDNCGMWIYWNWLWNHNKPKHNRAVCLFRRIYCIKMWMLSIISMA